MNLIMHGLDKNNFVYVDSELDDEFWYSIIVTIHGILKLWCARVSPENKQQMRELIVFFKHRVNETSNFDEIKNFATNTRPILDLLAI